MGNKIFFLITAILFQIFLGNSYSQDDTSIQDILEKVNKKVILLEDDKQEIVNLTIELLVGTKNSKAIYRKLDNTFTYTLIALTDKRIADMSITVYKKTEKDWEFVAETSGKNPTVTIIPTDYVLYEITFKAVEFSEGYRGGHFASFLYHIKPKN